MFISPRRILSDLFDAIVPPICSVCGETLDRGALGVLCGLCRDTLPPIGRAVCPTCGYPRVKDIGQRCRHCPPRPVYFESARSALLYRGALPDAFYAFKYNGHDEIGPTLAHILFDELEWYVRETPARDFLVPVPLHFLRRWRRGYNQSRILAAELGRLSGVPVVNGAVARTRHTPRQALQPRPRRLENVRGAFEVTDAALVRGSHIGLVDDLFTSGNTVNECARVLMESGAASVRVITLARA